MCSVGPRGFGSYPPPKPPNPPPLIPPKSPPSPPCSTTPSSPGQDPKRSQVRRRSSDKYVNLKRSTARRRYTPVYTHSGGASGRSEWEALPGMCLVGPSTAARRRCLGLWSGLRLGGSPRNRCLLQRHRAFPWSAVQRSASYRSLRKGVCRTLGPRPGKLAIKCTASPLT